MKKTYGPEVVRPCHCGWPEGQCQEPETKDYCGARELRAINNLPEGWKLWAEASITIILLVWAWTAEYIMRAKLYLRWKLRKKR